MKIKAAMRAWGPNALAWKGERAAVFPSTTVFAGDLVASVGFEPIPSANKLPASEPKLTIEHDGPPPPPPTATEYDDNPDMVPEGAVDDVEEIL
jgi:hypothetical protein